MKTTSPSVLWTASEKNCLCNGAKHPVPQEQQPSPLRGRPAAPEALDHAQRQFAAERHGLIFAFLHNNGWDAGEYYDIAALGFLRAVRRYLTEPDLAQYAFSTVAWRSMGQSIAAFHRAEARRRAAERRYLETKPSVAPDLLVELEAGLILHDLASVSSEEQYRLANLRLQGYSVAEIARTYQISPKRVRRLLKELYRVYLKLYQD